MSGKMTLYKLVVLGDGGVGKTALTIQVSDTASPPESDEELELTYHLPLTALPQPFCRNIRSNHRGLLSQTSRH